MNAGTATFPTYADLIRPGQARPALAYDMAMVFIGSLFMALTAQVVIPLPIVPITGQTFGVLLVGALLGSRRGAAALTLYLYEGAMGLPVFAGGSAGALHLVGPTAGYLIAFVPAAYVVGRLAEAGWDRTFARTLMAMTLATAVIFAGGLLWLLLLSIGLSTASPVAFDAAPSSVPAIGLWPYLPGAAVKIVLAALLLPVGWKVLGRTR